MSRYNALKRYRRVHYRDVDLRALASKIANLCRGLVSSLKDSIKEKAMNAVRSQPVMALLLRHAMRMTMFWDAVNGVKDIGVAAYKTFMHLVNKLLRLSDEVYSGKRTIKMLIRGIIRLGIAYFKYRASEKIADYV
jgi:hypothetical protein